MTQLVDPMSQTALLSLDFGDVFSPEGRAWQLTALTPVSMSPRPTAPISGAPATTPAAPTTPTTGNGLPDWANWLAWLLGDSHNEAPTHSMARIVILIIAIGIIFIVALRLTK